MFNIYMISTAGVADEDIDKCLQCAHPLRLTLVSAEFVLWEVYVLASQHPAARCVFLR